MIPNIIKAIKEITLMLENQNSSSPNTLTPRKLTRKTEVGHSVKVEDRDKTVLTQEDTDDHPDPYRYDLGPVVDNNACQGMLVVRYQDTRRPKRHTTRPVVNGARLTEYHDLTRCINVIRSNNEVFQKVVPSQRETHTAGRRHVGYSRQLSDVRRMPEPSGVASKALLVWEVGSHLSQADHCTVTYET